MIEGFLLGVVVTSSIVAAAFFYRFWRRTQDRLFLAFAAAFLIEGLNRLSFLFIQSPNEGSPAIYLVRLLAFLIIVMAIVAKNRRTQT
jgi:Family of unknown function (DUF5985)